MMGGTFDLEDVHIGKTREEPSRARIVIRTVSKRSWTTSSKRFNHTAPRSNVRQTAVRSRRRQRNPPRRVLCHHAFAHSDSAQERWVEVDGIEMDLAVRVDEQRSTAHTIPMGEVREGDQIVVGREGVRVTPLQRPSEPDVFGFMESHVSAERPHGHVIADIASRMRHLREQARLGQPGSNVLLSGGPAIIHAGGGSH